LVKSFNRKWLFTIDGKFPVGKEIVAVDFDPRNDEFVLAGWQLTRKKLPSGIE
jgi:hypothetical protein